MSNPKNNEPEWENSDSWDEFEWENTLKHSDHVAARYFRMLERFGDLPDAESFIAGRLGEQNFFEFQDEPFYLYEEEEGDDWQGTDDDDDDDDDDDGEEEEEQIGPGDTLYYETCPVYQRARQISLGWCNILASVLKPDDRMWGMKVLFHLGRILSYLSLAIGDGTFDRLPASIAFTKRSIQEVNIILGELDENHPVSSRYKSILKLVREHLLDTLDMLVALLLDLRKRSGSSDTDDLDI